MEAHGVQHPGGGLAKARWGSTLDGFAGEAFYDQAAETFQVNKVGKFEAVTECSAGGENRIAQAQCANLYAEIDMATAVLTAGRA